MVKLAESAVDRQIVSCQACSYKLRQRGGAEEAREAEGAIYQNLSLKSILTLSFW